MPCQPLKINNNDLEPCGGHHGYDYFAGSEVTYIIVWTSFGLIPLSKLKLNSACECHIFKSMA